MLNQLSIRELADLLGGQLQLGSLPPLGGDCEPVGRVVADVRDVQAGDLYWALETSPHDSAQRAEEAFARDAAGAVVSGRRLEPWAGKFSLTVADAQAALWQLARWMRTRFPGRVIAVSGSLGKTTTLQLLEAVLAEQFTGWTPGPGREDRFSLPLSLLGLEAAHDYCLVECSARTAAEIRDFSHLCDPEIVVINSLANRRTELADEHAVICESELVEQLPETGWAVLNGDVARLREFGEQSDAQVRRVGRGAHCDVTASGVRYAAGELSGIIDGTPFRVPAIGRHQLHAVLAAYAVGRILEIPSAEIAQGLRQFQRPPQRCEINRGEAVTVIDDTYDFRAASMWAALEVLRDYEGANRRIVVCGELAGPGSPDELQRQLGQAIVAKCGADILVACGRHSADLVAAAQAAGMAPHRTVQCQRAEEAAARLQRLLEPEDVVLVKGGPGLALAGLLDALLYAPQALSA